MMNQALLGSVAYKTYYAIASGADPPKSRKSKKKSELAISSEESPFKKKSAKAKKVVAAKPKPTKKKAPVKADRGKGLNVLLEVALSEAAQLKEATKQSKKDFHISQASGSSHGTNFESGVPDEQHRKTSNTDEGTGTKPGVLDVLKYYSKGEKESWGDSGEEDDDDENDSKYDNDDSDRNDDDDGNDSNDGDGDDDDAANDDDNQEDDDTNDDEEETDSDRTKSNRIKIPVLNQSTTKYYEEEEEEKFDNEEKMDEEDDEVTKELYKDVNVNSGNEDIDMTDADQVQSSYVSSDFTSKLLNLENPSLADNEIASLMDTIVLHEEPGSQTSPLYTVPVTTVREITSVFTITIPPPPSFFNPLSQQATPTLTPIASETTTSFPSLPYFSSVFKFNERVTNLEKDLSEIKQIDPEESQAEKRDYIELVDTSMRAILKEEVNTQLLRFSLKQSQTLQLLVYIEEERDYRDKDQDPSTRSDQGTKRRKSSKEVESSKDLRSKEKKYSSTSKDASHSQHKPSGNQIDHAEEPHTSFDELVDTSFDFSAFVMNRLNIKDLAQEILVGLAFELLKGTYKSLTELEYHFEEYSKATTERLDWHNPKGKPYLFDLSKPLPLIPDHRGR
ncbi:hypothetical protein Tco_0796252 [Tanacetum coccineum]